MLKTDEISNMWINGKKVTLKINKEYGTVKVNDIFFNSVESLNEFINKLSDISDELTETESEEQ